MDAELKIAKDALAAGDYTCILSRGGDLLPLTQRGVRPLLELLDSGEDFRGACAADKVVGKAAAFLYCLLGIRALYARVVSQPALAVLRNAGIVTHYDTLVSAIANRTNTGLCPMETAVRDLSDPTRAPEILKNTLKNLQKEAL